MLPLGTGGKPSRLSRLLDADDIMVAAGAQEEGQQPHFGFSRFLTLPMLFFLL